MYVTFVTLGYIETESTKRYVEHSAYLSTAPKICFVFVHVPTLGR